MSTHVGGICDLDREHTMWVAGNSGTIDPVICDVNRGFGRQGFK